MISPKSEQKTSNTDVSLNYSDFSLEDLRGQKQRFDSRFESKPFIAKTDFQKNYLQNLNNRKKSTFDDLLNTIEKDCVRPKRIDQQKIPYDSAKVVLWKIYKERLKQKSKEFIFSGNDKEVIQMLLKYFIGDASCGLDMDKGICLVGGVGMGKTFMMESFQQFCQKLPIKKFVMKGAEDVYDEMASSTNPTKTMTKYYKGPWCFDDLGAEPLIFQDYGNKRAYMERIFFKRNEAFRRGYMTTHVTTNLMPSDIKERYGERFYDRFKEMFNVIHMTAKSKR